MLLFWVALRLAGLPLRVEMNLGQVQVFELPVERWQIGLLDFLPPFHRRGKVALDICHRVNLSRCRCSVGLSDGPIERPHRGILMSQSWFRRRADEGRCWSS